MYSTAMTVLALMAGLYVSLWLLAKGRINEEYDEPKRRRIRYKKPRKVKDSLWD